MQLAGNEGFEPFSLLPPHELSVETIMRVTVSTFPTMQETGAGVLGLLYYVFISISNRGRTTEEVLMKHEFSAPSDDTTMFSF